MEWSELMDEVLRRCRQESERKQDRSKRTEQAILAAALRVFGRDGVSRSRIADIAAEAGISASTLYQYHDNKEDIAYAVPAAYLSNFYEEFAALVEGKRGGRERLRLYLVSIADFARRNPEWSRLFYLEIWPSVLVSGTPLSRSVDDFSRILIFLIRQGMEEGDFAADLDPYDTAALLLGSLNHVIITWLLYRRPKNLTKAGVSIVDKALALLDLDLADKARTNAPQAKSAV